MGSLSSNSNIANSTVITFNPQVGAAYTLQPGDSNKVITLSNAGGCTVKGNPLILGPGFHCWIEARNNAANLITQFAAEKFFINGATTAGVNSFNLSPQNLQTGIGWDDVVHIACDGVDWHVIQGGPLAAASLTLGALSTTGTYTPAQVAGIVGTTTNNDAQAGSNGEFGEIEVASGAGVTIATGTVGNVTSLPLTAGDYDVWGMVGANPNPAATVAYLIGGINNVSGTMPAGSLQADFVQFPVGVNFAATAPDPKVTVPMRRFSFGVGGGTVYLLAQPGFTVSNMAIFGHLLWRRRR